MDQLYRLKESVFSYISPPSKRPRIPSPPYSPVVGANGSASPEYDKKEGRTQQGPMSNGVQRRPQPNLPFTPVSIDFRRPSLGETTQPDSINLRKRARSESDEHSDSEDSGLNPDDSISQKSRRRDMKSRGTKKSPEADFRNRDADDFSEEGETVTPEEKVQEYLARQAEMAARLDDIEKARSTGNYHRDELYLFEKLSMRSFEAILPQEWKIDFPTLPHEVFTEEPAKQFFNTNATSRMAGVKALQSLLAAGTYVRDNLEFGRSTEKPLEKAVQSYITWSEKDGGFRFLRHLPVLVVMAAHRGQKIDAISAAITSQLSFLAEQHRDFLRVTPTRPDGDGASADGETYRRAPPLLYGIIVAQTVTIFVTLDSAKPDATIRHLQHYDYKVTGQDVWNGIAVAMVVIAARNYIMKTKGDFDEEDPASDEDS